MNISELLSSHMQNIPAALQSGDILKVAHSKDFKTLVVTAAFSTLTSEDELSSFEAEAAKALSLEKLQIKPRYNPSLWGIQAAFSAVNELRKTLPAVNGHFDDAKCEIDGNEITFEINKPVAFLEINRFNERFSAVVRELFSVNINVTVKGTNDSGELEKKRE
jgi:hypothetical protein